MQGKERSLYAGFKVGQQGTIKEQIEIRQNKSDNEWVSQLEERRTDIQKFYDKRKKKSKKKSN